MGLSVTVATPLMMLSYTPSSVSKMSTPGLATQKTVP
jgi:hypothetical protein